MCGAARRGRFRLTLVIGGLLLLPSGPGFAHAELELSNPLNGAILDESPRRLTARFSTELDTATSQMTLLAADGQSVDASAGGVDLDDADHASMVILITTPLPAGRYRVLWIARSAADGHMGHATEGELEFEIR